MRTYLRRAGWWAAIVVGVSTAGGVAVAHELPQLRGSVFGTDPGSHADPCLPGQAIPVLPSPHLSIGELAHVTYNSQPPTSGPHFAIPPAPGIYDSPLPPGEFVHAEEHGHVVIVYAPGTPRATVAGLEQVAKSYPGDVVLTPYGGIPHGIALAAWGRLETLDRTDRARIDAFVVALRGRYDHKWIRSGECTGGRSG